MVPPGLPGKAHMITPQPAGVPGVRNGAGLTGGDPPSTPRRGASSASMIASSGSGGPTALRILLGAQLRRLREAKQITLEDAGYVIRASGSKMSRLETGRVGFKSRHIAALLTLYGAPDEQERTALQDLALQASAVGWG